ncbi:MAG: aminotransferase class IV [Gammaproteobacteria bacterium]|nr:aminotransferase class IV [Gammaproteobacteria bacterium]
MVRIATKSPLPTVWLNGAMCKIDDAHISVLDRGFLFGDGIYEIIPVYRGVPLQPKKHIHRLLAGLNAISIDDPMGQARWLQMVTDLIAINGVSDVSVYIQVTRGAPTYRDHAFPADITPTVYAMCTPLPELNPDLIKKGIAAIVRPDTRWARRDIKSISLLANVLLRQEAVHEGVAETILCDGDYVTEGSASSVFAVIEDTIMTPPNGTAILPGTTRDLIMDLAAENQLPARSAELTRTQLFQAKEVWLCSSLRELLPVCRLDGNPVSDGRPGPLFRRMYELFQKHKRRLRGQAA